MTNNNILIVIFLFLFACSPSERQFDQNSPQQIVSEKMPASIANGFSDAAVFSDNESEAMLTLHKDMQSLASDLLNQEQFKTDLHFKYRAFSLLEHNAQAIETVRHMIDTGMLNRDLLLHYELYLKARLRARKRSLPFDLAFRSVFEEEFAKLSDEEAYQAGYYATYRLDQGALRLAGLLKKLKGNSKISPDTASELIRHYQDYSVYRSIMEISTELLSKDINRRYVVKDDALIETQDGATLSAIVVRPCGAKEPLPTALLFTVYAYPEINKRRAVHAAAHGYAGVVADARGKRLGKDEIRIYETEAKDVNAVISWATKQSWSDERVAMYGGSYEGFAQWAALKYPNPALKTIVPYVAVIPGLGLPMENNIFLNANYGWAFYTTNGPGMDEDSYFDRQRWNALNSNWFKSGRSYREIDAVDGLPNAWLQRWLSHPSYDTYWQSMVPYKEEYSAINIPVLSISGYYDDSQISALHYLAEHETHHDSPNHYLIIGPYDHFGAQSKSPSALRGYDIDDVAKIDVPEITFDWFDHVLNGEPKPVLIKDRINYQLMGDNTWRYARSLSDLNSNTRRFYFGTREGKDGHFPLLSEPEEPSDFLAQKVDLADRNSTSNDYYPWPIIRDSLEIPNGFAFASSPFVTDMELSGQFSGAIKVKINKKDFDLGLTFYELRPDGSAFHLSYHLGRASFAKDPTKRQLLVPNHVETIPFSRTRMTAKRIQKGSRLLVVANVNKNEFAQVNYGTGGDVSDESTKDAAHMLEISWVGGSYIDVPIRKRTLSESELKE